MTSNPLRIQTLKAELFSQFIEITGNDVECGVRFRIWPSFRSMFKRAQNKGRLESDLPGTPQVILVGRYHHDLIWPQFQKIGGHPVYLLVRLVMSRQFR